MAQDDLETRFAHALAEHRWLARDSTVIAAVSGGPDSVALLHLLGALNRTDAWSLSLHVAHLNHGLRGQASDGDAAFVRGLADELALPCTVERVDASAAALERRASVEEAARQCRLDFLERLCLRLGVTAVALGHQADDNAETVLQRVIRGTGLRGLAGIRPERPIRYGSDIRLIRPMLRFHRAEIKAYLDGRGLPFRRDASNESDAHTRNRIRNRLLPLLRDQFNPQVTEALLRLAEQARDLEAYLAVTCERVLESLVVQHDDRQLALHAPSLARRPRAIQTELIRRVVLRMGIGERDLSYAHFGAVVELAADSAGTKALDLPGGLRVSRRYARLVFERTSGEPFSGSAEDQTGPVRVPVDATTPLPGHRLQITVEVLPADTATLDARIRGHVGRVRGSTEEWLDADQVHPPLVARSRRPGDRFFPLGMRDMKKLSDFFIDEKVDARSRDRAVVLCDQLGPIWIVPFRIDERVRLTRATRRVLRLQVTPLMSEGLGERSTRNDER